VSIKYILPLLAALVPAIAQAQGISGNLVLYTSQPNTDAQQTIDAFKATVRADGTLALGAIVGSIHKIGALTQGLPACNGWTFWHVERRGRLVCIDEFRTAIRATLTA